MVGENPNLTINYILTNSKANSKLVTTKMLTRNLVSRALLIRSLKNAADNVKQAKRNSGHGVWTYRMPPPLPSKRAILIAEVLGGLAWYWVFYHIATEPEHIYGEWPYIEPSTWSDAELGIPPDSQGLLKKE